MPLDAWAMRDLAYRLSVLAESIEGREAEFKRARAQMLALSLAVDPGNSRARQSLRTLVKGAPLTLDDPKRLRGIPARIRELMAWLDQDEAGSDGMALAACLKDIVRYADGGSSEGLKEFGAWSGWVADLKEFEGGSSVVKHTDPVEPDKPEDPVVPDKPVDPVRPKPSGKFEFTLKNAQIVTPMWQMNGNRSSEGWSLEACPLRVDATYQPDAEWQPFAMRIGPPDSPIPLFALQERLTGLLREQHEKLPQGLVLSVNSTEFSESLRSGQDHSISAVVAVLASSIVSERKPVAMVIGSVDEGGKIRTGSNFWSKLRALKKGQGERLVVSSDAEEYLDGLLTLRDLDFFFDHEVYFATNYDQLLDRALDGGSPAAAKASEKFKVIQQTAKGQNLQRFVVNTFVRKRLEEVLAEDPNHASAKILLKISNNQRSNSVGTRVMASEILRVLRPALQVAKVQHHEILWQNVPLPDLRLMDKKIQDELSDFLIYMDRNDRGWVDRAKLVSEQVRMLDRAINGKSGDRNAAIFDACSRLSQVADAAENELGRMADR